MEVGANFSGLRFRKGLNFKLIIVQITLNETDVNHGIGAYQPFN